MKTKVFLPLFLAIVMNAGSFCMSQNVYDTALVYANRAFSHLRKANIINGLSLGFGLAGNIEMIALKGFPMESQGGQNAIANLSHAAIGISRVTTSIFPPIQVANARHDFKPLMELPEVAASYKQLFNLINTAQFFTAIAPILTVAGGIMMGEASRKIDYTDYDYPYNNTKQNKNVTLKTVGWICVGAGLCSTIVSAVLISKAKNDLSEKIGTLKINASGSKIGLVYNFPSK